MRHVHSKCVLVVLTLACVTLLFASQADADGQGAEHSKPVHLRILAFNDFHGHIDSQLYTFGWLSGGADYLATYLRFYESQADNTVIISAGDLIGGSPLVSGFFHDEPTIEIANLLGVDVAAVGNHEFDEGVTELLRMQSGGCHPRDGCQDGDGFEGADFPFLAANVVDDATGETLFPPVWVKNYQGVRVAFIGLTLENTPTIVNPSGIAGWSFLDEAETINAIVPMLQQINIEAIVVVLHQGGYPTGPLECGGPIVDIVERTDPAVDLFITGHTHWSYLCVIDDRLVTSAWAEGRLFTLLDVELNRVTKDMTIVGGGTGINARNVAPEPDVRTVIDKYRELSDPIARTVIGSITADIRRVPNAAGESALGDVVADALLATTADPGFGDADVAFTNSGGLRVSLFYAAGGEEADGEVTYEEAWTMMPFNNHLVTMTLTGAQLEQLLELQFVRSDILQVSVGFEYAWSSSAPVGAKVDPASIRIGGVPIDLSADYRVSVPNFIAAGGGGFGEVFLAGTNRLTGALDLDALADYFAIHSPVPPGPQDRITRLP